MTAELWLMKPDDNGFDAEWVRLDPDKVVPISVVRSREDGLGIRSLTVQDVIDALEEE